MQRYARHIGAVLSARTIGALMIVFVSPRSAGAVEPDVTVGDAPNVVPTLPNDMVLPASPGPSVHDVAASTVVEHTSGGGGLPQFDATWFPSQIFWLGITFLILYRFFSRMALPRIANTIAARAGQVSGDISRAEQLAEQAKSVRVSYERDIARAKDKAGEAIRDVDHKIKLKTADLLYSYRTKLTMETTRAADDLMREKERLITDMHKLAAQVTAQATSQILDSSVDMDQAARMIETLDPARRAA